MGRNFVEMLFEVRGAFPQSFSPFRYIYDGQPIVKSQPWVVRFIAPPLYIIMAANNLDI